MDFFNSFEDAKRAEAYVKLEFPGTYYLAYRDLPEVVFGHVGGRIVIDFGRMGGGKVLSNQPEAKFYASKRKK
jgi:hypothetical protein